MIVTKVTRKYTRSVNAKSYGLPDSLVSITAEYEGQVESGDDPVKLSNELHTAAQNDVIGAMDAVIEKMKVAAGSLRAVASGSAPSQPANAAPSAGAPVGSPRSL